MHLGTISRASRAFYLRELKSVVAHCLTTDKVQPFRRFVWSWIKKGAPIDPACLQAPLQSLKIVLRQLCVALSIPGHVADARLWLTMPECRYSRPGESLTLEGVLNAQRQKVARFKGYDECFIPWNLALYAPEGTAYAAFNRTGFTLEEVD